MNIRFQPNTLYYVESNGTPVTLSSLQIIGELTVSQFLTTPDPNGDKRLLCAYKSEINFLTDCITHIKGSSLTLKELRQCMKERKIELEERAANLKCSISAND